MGTILRRGIILALVLTPLTASAFNLPPINLGFTNFIDGGVPPGPQPGVFYLAYLNWYYAEKFRDAKGNSLPGSNRVSVLSDVNQLAILSPLKEPLTQGLLGWDLLIPLLVFHANTSIGPPGGLKANPDVLGDLIFGPFIQWNHHSIFDRPYLHRFEIDVSAPTGSYSKAFDLNPGSNLWTVNPYYAHTLWFPRLDLEISLRHHWLYSTENPETEIKPGQAYHVNYAASYGLTQKVRVGVNGYYLQQLTNDRLSGRDIEGSKERVASWGLGLVYAAPAMVLMVNYFAEFEAENRPEGFHLQGRIIFAF